MYKDTWHQIWSAESKRNRPARDDTIDQSQVLTLFTHLLAGCPRRSLWSQAFLSKLAMHLDTMLTCVCQCWLGHRSHFDLANVWSNLAPAGNIYRLNGLEQAPEMWVSMGLCGFVSGYCLHTLFDHLFAVSRSRITSHAPCPSMSLNAECCLRKMCFACLGRWDLLTVRTYKDNWRT